MTRRRLVLAMLGAAAVVAVVAAVLIALERDASSDTRSHEEPATVEPIGDGSLSRVRLTEQAAERLGLRTAPVSRANSGRLVVPYSALLYDPAGKTWVYTEGRRMTFARTPVAVGRIEGNRVVLVAGPPAGTPVVTVGVAELYGAELGIDH